MKYTFLLFYLFLFAFSADASHSYGGYIAYESMGNRTYEFTIYLYVDGNSPASNRNEILFNYGDQSPMDSLVRDSMYQYYNQVYVATYKGVHTYQGNGTYVASLTDPNRASTISNVANPSSQPLYLETSLNTTIGNNSIQLFQPAHFFVKTDTSLIQNLNLMAYDSDGDRLIYELINSKDSTNTVLTGYQSPPLASINRFSGQISWSPNLIGNFLFTVKVSKYRNNQLIAHTLVDFVVESNPSKMIQAEFQTGPTYSLDSCGVYSITVAPGDTVVFLSGVTQRDPNSSTNTNFFVNYFTELDSNIAPYSINYLGLGRYWITFRWLTDSLDSRCAPYYIYFRAREQDENEDFALQIYVLDSSNQHCDTICNSPLISVEERALEHSGFSVYPNPTDGFLKLRLDKNISSSNLSLKVFNLTGQLVKEIRISKPIEQFYYQFEESLVGLHILQLQSDEGIIGESKVIFR